MEIKIDRIVVDWESQYISGKDILEYAGLSVNEVCGPGNYPCNERKWRVWKFVNGPADDEELDLEDKVDLSKERGEPWFFTGSVCCSE